MMSYLINKKARCYDTGVFEAEEKYKEGTIVSEPFPKNCENGFDYAAVVVLWDDGTMSGAVDVDEIEVIEDRLGYVVVAEDDRFDDPDDKKDGKKGIYKGPIILESYFNQSSLQEVTRRIASLNTKLGKCRIAKLQFIEEK